MIFHYIWASVTMFWCLTFHDSLTTDYLPTAGNVGEPGRTIEAK
jgi:hypothetical protein